MAWRGRDLELAIQSQPVVNPSARCVFPAQKHQRQFKLALAKLNWIVPQLEASRLIADLHRGQIGERGARDRDLSSVIALGVDTLTCWGTGASGWRPADRWLRKQYKTVQSSVMTPNGLFGSMGLNGMSVLIVARGRSVDVPITETHPEVLYWHMCRQKYDYEHSKAEMDATLSRTLGTSVAPATEHEWDAALSAFAALEGLTGRWPRDLHKLSVGADERLITPCGDTNYFWPE